ncbi:suppressor protein SRP40-like [Papaver somniferum]|uniref:suppressor protein SRP40-like n=1 Tax=Papaver somniferum TaxID=3469 RepID=UPI000E6FF5CD|nr:suppressor protein SRP40-like [Papaver somniferum]
MTDSRDGTSRDDTSADATSIDDTYVYETSREEEAPGVKNILNTDDDFFVVQYRPEKRLPGFSFRLLVNPRDITQKKHDNHILIISSTLPHDGRVVRPRINVDFTEVEESPRGGEARSKDYRMLPNNVKSPAVSLGEKENSQELEPNEGDNVPNGDADNIDPSNDLETTQKMSTSSSSNYSSSSSDEDSRASAAKSKAKTTHDKGEKPSVPINDWRVTYAELMKRKSEDDEAEDQETTRVLPECKIDPDRHTREFQKTMKQIETEAEAEEDSDSDDPYAHPDFINGPDGDSNEEEDSEKDSDDESDNSDESDE